MKMVLFLAAIALAGCGIDGPPEPVPAKVKISGTASVGVSGRF